MPEVKVNEDKTETVTDRVLNSQKAIWLRKPSEITEEEYKSFYSHLSNFGGTEYLKAIHLSAEGTSEFKALLFLPKQAPFNLLMPEVQKRGLQLYVRRVFITDECKELVPDYLRFICGVVDSNDLPLNVSREILQENPQLCQIMDRFCADLDYLIPAPRDAPKYIFVTKLHKRLSHRRLADTKMFNHLSFGKDAVWSQPARTYFLDYPLIDLVLQCAFLFFLHNVSLTIICIFA